MNPLIAATVRRSAVCLLLGIGLGVVLIAPPVGAASRTSAKATRKGTAARKPAPKKPAAKAPAKKDEGAGFSVDDHPLVKSLAQVGSGPGVLVCEPVAKGAKAETVAFGGGCARWLHLVVGGHGEFGKTPLWSSLYHTQLELGRKDLRLTAADGARLRESLGVTHAALGEIQGDAARCTLTYQLWDLAARKPVGEPVRRSGAEDEVLAGLPEVAAKLTRALGVAEPRVPKAVGETAAELRFLGSLRWFPERQLEEARAKQLADLAGPAPAGSTPRPQAPVLAAFLALLHAGDLSQGARVIELSRQVATALPGNALLFGDIGRMANSAQADPFSARTGNVEYVDTPQGKRAFSRSTPKLPFVELKALLERFPNNYLLNSSQAHLHQVGQRFEEARKSAEQSVRCARGNSDAWLGLSDAISKQADAIRSARFINQLSEQELAQIGKFYEEWLPIALKAVQVDPHYGSAWLEASSAACFLGVEELADGAYGRAISLTPRAYPVLWWGLEMYQPKWLDQPEKLKVVADLAVEAAGDFDSGRRLELAKSMQHGGLQAQAEKMLRTDAEREALKKHGEHLGDEH
jgi:hypothetical protein